MNDSPPEWKLYELLIARLIADQISTDLCVTPNARLKGKISGRVRQIDVLIDSRHDTDNSRRIIVDAKKRTRKIDVIQVEAFKGLMEDVGARHGYLVCPVGHTKAAEKRAQQSITIRLVPLEQLKNFDPTRWDRCLVGDCKQGYVFWDGYPEMSLGLHKVCEGKIGPKEYIPYVYMVGKCDRCARFHVKCLTCQDFSQLDNYEGHHRCRCPTPWFWLASIENDEKGHPSAELHLVTGFGEVITVNRRAM
jgi:hypothetical protein